MVCSGRSMSLDHTQEGRPGARSRWRDRIGLVSERIYVNGIDASTGRALPAPETDSDLVRALDWTPSERRELRWWVERFGVNDPTRGPVSFADPTRLDSAGWGIVYAPGTQEDARYALEPLLRLRRQLAGTRYREFEYQPGESKRNFLTRHRVFPGPVDP